MSCCKCDNNYSTTAKFDTQSLLVRILLNTATWSIVDPRVNWGKNVYACCATGEQRREKGVAHSALPKFTKLNFQHLPSFALL